jgi:phage shock protein C
MNKTSDFVRYPRDGYIGGVCAGLAAYFDWNVRLIRVLAVLALIFGGGFPILLIYLVLWYVMSDEGGRAPYRGERDGHHRSRTYRDEARPQTRQDVRMRFMRLEERLNSMDACITSHDYELRRELRKLEG